MEAKLSSKRDTPGRICWTKVKQCKKALGRGQGRKKAVEVKLEDRHLPKKLNFNKTEKAVKFGKDLFIPSVVWMLRDLELAALSTGDFSIDHITKRVNMHLKLSKMDSVGKDVTRTLQCLCVTNDCDRECPYVVTTNVVSTVEKLNGTDSPFMLTKAKAEATKAQLAKTWRWLYGAEVTGHSGGRTGALSYVRVRWSITQSNAILQYANEALQHLPANLNLPGMLMGKGGIPEPKVLTVTEEELKTWKAQPKAKLEDFKTEIEKKDVNPEELFEYWVKFYKENPENPGNIAQEGVEYCKQSGPRERDKSEHRLKHQPFC